MGKNVRLDAEQALAIAKVLVLKDETWASLGGEIIKVVDESNAAYGDSTEKSAKLLSILWPDGIPPERFHDVRCMISILDKLSRIATDKDAFNESPWRDCAGYALLAYRHDLKEHTERER